MLNEQMVSEQNIGLSETIPAVTWLICTNVCNELLHEALKSCLDQSFSDFEIVLVANGPDSSEIEAQVLFWFGTDPRIRVVITDVRYLTFSLTLGLHHARAELIARMDSDDISTLDRLDLQVAFMQAHPDVAVLGSAYEMINNQGISQKKINLPTEDKHIRQKLFLGNPICHPSVMFRRKVVLAAGGYLGYIFAEDYDLWVRLARNQRIRFANLKDVCLKYRMSSNTVGLSRRSRQTYASVAASQMRCFLLGQNRILWGFATLLSFMKVIALSNKKSKDL